jgi:hypothetical protein
LYDAHRAQFIIRSYDVVFRLRAFGGPPLARVQTVTLFVRKAADVDRGVMTSRLTGPKARSN